MNIMAASYLTWLWLRLNRIIWLQCVLAELIWLWLLLIDENKKKLVTFIDTICILVLVFTIIFQQ